MDFGLNEGQQMLKTSAREFLERECSNLYVRDMEKSSKGYSEEMWNKLVELGWLGLVIPEKQGGLELNFLELALILEEMGRVNFPGPYFSTVVLGGMTILEAGNAQQKDEYLPLIAEGKAIFSMALTEPTASWAPSGIEATAKQKDDQYILSGTKLFVSNGDTADYFIVAARTSDYKDPQKGITIFIVPSNSKAISETSLKTVASDHQSELVFENVILPTSTILGEKDAGWPIIQKILEYAAVGKCAEMIGGAEKVLDMTIDYVKQRKQFGNAGVIATDLFPQIPKQMKMLRNFKETHNVIQ